MNAKHGRYFLLILSITTSLVVSSCGKKASESAGSGSSQIEIPGGKTDKIKVIKLGASEEFSILAYASISSVPNSNIAGKVGLMPGTKEQITLSPSEVAGGAADIFGNDDETTPINLLSNAKVDMVTTYMNATKLIPDPDKLEIYAGVIDEKVLTPGVYSWGESVTISKDFTLQGNETDIFIFKINGHLKVGEGVQMILAGGVKADHILWQVAGSAELLPRSSLSGTLIAQPSIEMRSHSVLVGRAFCKNGFVNLNQATIKKP